MIILLGPDHSGKTTLARQLAELDPPGTPGIHAEYWNADQHTEYLQYLDLLSGHRIDNRDAASFRPGSGLERSTQIVADRFFYCEGPYSEVYRQIPQRWNLKQLHNLHLLTLAHNPVIVLTNRIGPDYESREQLVGKKLFYPILNAYEEYISMYGLWPRVLPWNWKVPPMSVRELADFGVEKQSKVVWWRNLMKKGIGGIGNTVNPKVVLVAEEIGPNNTHNLPFETGPSGYYLTDLLDQGDIPLSEFYITNYHRAPTQAEDNALFAKEMQHLTPQSVILLGAEARKCIPICQALGIRIYTLNHPGWVVNHAHTLRDKELRKKNYLAAWKIAWKEALSSSRVDSKTAAGKPTRPDLPPGSREIELVRVQ